jgi:hypothetical protein
MAQMQCKFSVQCFQADSLLVLEDITWLTRSPDYAVLDYFLSGFDKSKVEQRKSANTDNSKFGSVF